MASTLTETRSLCLSADEEAELVRSVESLGGKAQALQFIEMVFKFGHSCVQQLLDDPSPGKDYSPDPATCQSMVLLTPQRLSKLTHNSAS